MPTHINKAKCWNKCQTLHYREILALPTRPSFDVSRAPVRRVRIVSDQFVLRHVLHQTECPHTHTWTSSKPHMQSLSQLSPPNQTECLANTHYTVTHMNSLQFFWNYPELSIQFKLYFWILSVSVSVLNLTALVSVLDFKDECCLQAVSKWNAYGYRPFHQQSYTISYRLCTEFGGDYAVLAMPRRSRTCRCLVWSERTCPARNYTALLCPVYLGRSTTSQRASACRSQRLSDDFLPGQRPCRRICSQYR